MSKIGLAKARLERNEADGAREILKELEDSPQLLKGDSWEWRWLWRQANQSESVEKADAAVIDLSVGSYARHAAVALTSGQVELLTLSDDGRLSGRQSVPAALSQGARATSVAVAADESVVAIGTQSGGILLLPLNDSGHSPASLPGHAGRVNDLQFTLDGLLVSGSDDKTVRVWDTTSNEQRATCWHISPVQQVAVAGSGESMTLAVAASDDVTGRVAIWSLSRQGDVVSAERQGTLTEHRYPVSSVAISADGRTVASGDSAGNLLLWDPDEVPPIDYDGSIEDALARLDGKGNSRTDREPVGSNAPQVTRLVDSSSASELRLVSTASERAPTQHAHDDVIKSIRFTADGKSLVTSSDDYTLKVWDVDERRIDKTLKGHGGWVVGAEFLRGANDVIVSASNDATVRSWRPGNYVGAFFVQQSTGDASSPIRQRLAHDKEIGSASFSPNGDRIVTASHDHTARVMQIDPQTLAFKEVARLEEEVLREGTSFVAMSLQVDRRNERLYVGSADATIRVWDLTLGTEIGEAQGTGLNTTFAVSRDGKRMLTGSSSPEVKAKLWELDPVGTARPRIIQRLQGHEQAVTAFAISPDSKLLFTGDRGGFGILWDAATGKRIGSPVEDVRGFRINAASFSADGSELLIGSDDEQLTVIDVKSRERVTRLDHDGVVTQLSLSDDGRRALAVSELSTQTEFRSAAVLWDLRSGRARVLDRVVDQRDDGELSSRRIRQRITSAQLDPAGKVAVVSYAAPDDQPAVIRVWRLDQPAGDRGDDNKGSEIQLPKTLGTAEVVLPIDGQTLLTMNENAAFKWDLRSDELIKSYRAHAELTEASFSFDGQYVATGSRSVKIWDAATGQAVAKLESPRPIRTVQFAPQSSGPTQYVFATGGHQGIAELWTWNPETREIVLLDQHEIAKADGESEPPIIRRVRFSPDADRLLVVGDAGLARVLDLKQAGESLSLDTPDGGDFRCAGFSEDGTLVAAGGTDKLVRIWDLSKADEQMDPPIVLSGHADTVNDLALFGTSRFNLRVMTASSDDTARVWDPRLDVLDDEGKHPGGREVISLRQHSGDVTAIAITDVVEDSDKDQLLMTAGRDGTVILWPAAPPRNLFDSVKVDQAK